MRSLLRAGLGLGLLAAACGKDSIGPKSLANPQATTAQMAALDTLFNAAALNSFSALAPSITPVAPARLTALRALAAAANPFAPSSALRPYTQGLESAQMVRQLLPTLTTAAAGDLFPPQVDGKTFEWNINTSMYQPTARTGAPSAGVRFILYAVDPLTHLPVQPLVEVGYVDLDDESSATVAKLHVTVAGVGGTPVYVDYRITLEGLSTSSARITSGGYITNGAGSPDTLRFNGVITAAGTPGSASVTQDVSLDVNSRDAHVRLWEKVTLTQTSVNLRIYFRFKHGAEVVTLDGALAADNVLGTVTGTITAKVDGGAMATCTVTANSNTYSLTCQGADADGLNADEQAALHAIGDAVGKVQEIFNGLFGPPLGILGA
jgi:hypothetical protein